MDMHYYCSFSWNNCSNTNIYICKKHKKRTSELKDIHLELKPGMKIMFCGGIYGKIVSVGKETVEVEVSKNVVITISRYSIQNIA